jgi:hypothetical protein
MPIYITTLEGSPLDARKLARAPPAGPVPTTTHCVEKSALNFGLSLEDIFVEALIV